MTLTFKETLDALAGVLPCTVEPAANCGGNHPNNCAAHYRYAVARWHHQQTFGKPDEHALVLEVVEAAKQFGSGGDWGTLKAWMAEGAPDRDDGIAAARLLTSLQVKLDAALARFEASNAE